MISLVASLLLAAAPTYTVSGVHAAALDGCWMVNGCISDVMAVDSGGSTVRKRFSSNGSGILTDLDLGGETSKRVPLVPAVTGAALIASPVTQLSAIQDSDTVASEVNVVLALGTSITNGLSYGGGITTPWPTALDTNLGQAWIAVNGGVHAVPVENATGAYNQTYVYPPGYVGYTRCIVELGVNDLVLFGDNAANVASELQALMLRMRTYGCSTIGYVGQLPIGSCTVGGGCSVAEQDAYDTLRSTMQTWCSENGVTFIPVTSLSETCNASGSDRLCWDTAPTDYDFDTIHPTQAGLDALEALVRATIFP